MHSSMYSSERWMKPTDLLIMNVVYSRQNLSYSEKYYVTRRILIYCICDFKRNLLESSASIQGPRAP
jgi:hypothetical protein